MTITRAEERTLKGIVCGSRHLTPDQFEAQLRRAAQGLHEMGVRSGDCVAIFMRNDIPFMVAARAAAYLGAYAVPVNWHLSGEEMAYILEDSGARVLVTHADLWRTRHESVPAGIECIVVETPEDLRRAYDLDVRACSVPADVRNWQAWLEQVAEIKAEPQAAPAAILYTSGTTGQPKGVLRTAPPPETALKLYNFYMRMFGLHEGSRAIVPGPLYHSAPNTYARQASIGCELLVIQPRFDAEDFIDLVERYRLTGANMVPIMFIRMLKLPQAVRERYDVSSMEFIIHAAAPCPADVKTAMIEWFGPVINEYYGSTESSAITFCDSEQALARPGTVGKPVPEADVRVLDEHGQPLPTGEIGEIYSRFPETDFTYNRKAEARAKIDVNGYITSGDMGYFDADGFLFIADRIKDMVISGGVNIYPAEIEAVLHAYPGVKDCAVFGIPDGEYGESVMAVLEPQDADETLDLDAVRGFLREHLAGFKVPRVMEIRHSLPREDSGKIFKRRIRDEFWSGTGRRI